MSTNALAFLLLTKFRKGAKLETLVGALEDLKRDFLAANKDVGFSGDSVDVINYAVRNAILYLNTVVKGFVVGSLTRAGSSKERKN